MDQITVDQITVDQITMDRTTERRFDFHVFVGDSNDGTRYDHTVNDLTLDEAIRHATRQCVKPHYRKRLMDSGEGDDSFYSLRRTNCRCK
jgi:hypothetical protein